MRVRNIFVALLMLLMIFGLALFTLGMASSLISALKQSFLRFGG